MNKVLSEVIPRDRMHGTCPEISCQGVHKRRQGELKAHQEALDDQVKTPLLEFIRLPLSVSTTPDVSVDPHVPSIARDAAKSEWSGSRKVCIGRDDL